MMLLIIMSFSAHLYESTGSYCSHPDISLAWTLASHFKVLQQNFLCDGQGTVRLAILCAHRFC